MRQNPLRTLTEAISFIRMRNSSSLLPLGLVIEQVLMQQYQLVTMLDGAIIFHPYWSPSPVFGTALEFFWYVLKNLFFKARVRHRFLQLGVPRSKILVPPQLRDFKPSVFLLPIIEGGITDTLLTAHLLGACSRFQLLARTYDLRLRIL